MTFYRSADPKVSDVPATLAAIRRSPARSPERRDPLPEHPSPVAVIGATRLMLHQEVDPKLERERLSKESVAWRAKQEARAKLGNSLRRARPRRLSSRSARARRV